MLWAQSTTKGYIRAATQKLASNRYSKENKNTNQTEGFLWRWSADSICPIAESLWLWLSFSRYGVFSTRSLRYKNIPLRVCVFVHVCARVRECDFTLPWADLINFRYFSYRSYLCICLFRFFFFFSPPFSSVHTLSSCERSCICVNMYMVSVSSLLSFLRSDDRVHFNWSKKDQIPANETDSRVSSLTLV